VQIDRGHPLSRGLALCYLLNEGAGSRVNDSVRGRGGSLLNSPTWQAGQGQGLRFIAGQSSSVSLNSPPLSSGNVPFTMVALFRTESTTTSYLYAEANTGSNNTLAEIGFSGVNVRIPVRNDTGTLLIPAANVNYTDGNWHVLAGVSEGNGRNALLYYDGRLIASASNALGTNITPNAAAIGSRPQLSPVYGTVDIAGVWGYNRILSAGEVAQLSAEPFQMFGKIAVPVYYSIGSRISPFWYARNVHQ